MVRGRRSAPLEITAADGAFQYTYQDKRGSQRTVTGQELDRAFAQSGMYEFMAGRMKDAAAYVESARAGRGNSTNAMREIFELE